MEPKAAREQPLGPFASLLLRWNICRNALPAQVPSERWQSQSRSRMTGRRPSRSPSKRATPRGTGRDISAPAQRANRSSTGSDRSRLRHRHPSAQDGYRCRSQLLSLLACSLSTCIADIIVLHCYRSERSGTLDFGPARGRLFIAKLAKQRASPLPRTVMSFAPPSRACGSKGSGENPVTTRGWERTDRSRARPTRRSIDHFPPLRSRAPKREAVLPLPLRSLPPSLRAPLRPAEIVANCLYQI